MNAREGGGGTWSSNIRGSATGKSEKLRKAGKFLRNLSINVEILPSRQFESHSQNANGQKRPFGVKNDKYGPCHGADFYKNDTLSRSRNPENDTLFSGTSPYRKIYEYPHPGDEWC